MDQDRRQQGHADAGISYGPGACGVTGSVGAGVAVGGRVVVRGVAVTTGPLVGVVAGRGGVALGELLVGATVGTIST